MDEWPCPLCPFEIFEAVTMLAQHVQLWHDEWLMGNRVPPMVYRLDVT